MWFNAFFSINEKNVLISWESPKIQWTIYTIRQMNVYSFIHIYTILTHRWLFHFFYFSSFLSLFGSMVWLCWKCSLGSHLNNSQKKKEMLKEWRTCWINSHLWAVCCCFFFLFFILTNSTIQMKWHRRKREKVFRIFGICFLFFFCRILISQLKQR